MDNLAHSAFESNQSCDIAASIRFITAFAPQGQPKWFFTCDDNRKRNNKTLLRNRRAAFQEAVTDLIRANRGGAGVFFSPNATDPCTRRKDSITSVCVVHGDFDNGLPEAGFPIEPTVEIETSPGRHQALWLTRSDDALSPDAGAAINHTIAVEYGADIQAKDIARCIRLPGFLHQKAKPHLVRVVGGCRRRHAAADLIAAFPPQQVQTYVSPYADLTLSSDNSEPYRRQALHDLRQACLTLSDLTDNRRNMAFSLACQLAKYVSNRVLSETEVRAGLRQAAAANGSVLQYGAGFVDSAITRALNMGRNDSLPPLARAFWQEASA